MSDAPSLNLSGVHSIGWLTDVIEANSKAKAKEAFRYGAVVLRPDIFHKQWGKKFIDSISPLPKLAYVRAPVHYNDRVYSSSPFEYAVKLLVERNKAQAVSVDGSVQRHPAGYDVYIAPSLLDICEHARLVKTLVWDTGVWAGLFVDGLVTNQIYCLSPHLLDVDRDGKADVAESGWAYVAERQRLQLSRWCRWLYHWQIPFIANGGWEPLSADRYGEKWPPLLKHSWLMYWSAGMCMERFAEYPYYRYSRSGQTTGPQKSLLWDLYARCTLAWVGRGKVAIGGGGYWGAKGGHQFVALSVRLLGGIPLYAVPDLGMPVSEAMNEFGVSIHDCKDNMGSHSWERRYERGRIVINVPELRAEVRKP